LFTHRRWASVAPASRHLRPDQVARLSRRRQRCSRHSGCDSFPIRRGMRAMQRRSARADASPARRCAHATSLATPNGTKREIGAAAGGLAEAMQAIDAADAPPAHTVVAQATSVQHRSPERVTAMTRAPGRIRSTIVRTRPPGSWGCAPAAHQYPRARSRRRSRFILTGSAPVALRKRRISAARASLISSRSMSFMACRGASALVRAAQGARRRDQGSSLCRGEQQGGAAGLRACSCCLCSKIGFS
jgi:hypothetical protein